ncbi:MAG: hypothetical protein WCR53_04730 [Bacteroidaceae bacterium]
MVHTKLVVSLIHLILFFIWLKFYQDISVLNERFLLILCDAVCFFGDATRFFHDALRFFCDALRHQL